MAINGVTQGEVDSMLILVAPEDKLQQCVIVVMLSGDVKLQMISSSPRVLMLVAPGD